jgi:hypothetical protein
LTLYNYVADVPTTESDPDVASFSAKCEEQFLLYKEQRGIFQRSSVITNRRELQPHRWWQLYCNHLPELQSLAVRVLSQLASASICERNWSIHGMIHDKKRARLKPSRAIDLVFIHQTIRLRDSLQDPFYNVEPLPWMDSDETESDPANNSEDDDSE